MTSVGDTLKWAGIESEVRQESSPAVQNALAWLMEKEPGKSAKKDEDMADEAGDHDHGQDHETAASTPTSSAQHNQSKAPKDRSCPFCGQSFTSSSLGRHLDLYIKPKNPKPPDGVHNVDEIRKIRGGITRRQARTSLKEPSSSGDRPGSEKPRTWDAARREQSAGETPAQSPQNRREMEMSGMSINAPNWHATGVIPNLPPRSNNATPSGHSGQWARTAEMKSDGAGRPVHRPTIATESSADTDMWKLQEAAEAGRAAELALRELLGSLEAARKRVEPLLLFDEFDFFSLSFPGLCLNLLPPPGTLFSSAPFPSPESWFLTPPGKPQRDTMARKLQERVRDRRQAARERGEKGHMGATDEVVFRHNAHLEAAFEHWKSIPPQDQEQRWIVEVLRAFAREKDAKASLERELERERQHSRHLEAQYDRLARCQLPREWQLRPPTTVPIPPAVARHANLKDTKLGVNEADYDADALIHKWKATVKAVARTSRTAPTSSMSGSHALVETQTPSQLNSRLNADLTARQLDGDYIMNGSVWGGIGGAMKRGEEDFRPPNPADTRDGNIISYETPPQPGTVLGGAEGEEGGSDNENEEDAAGEVASPYSSSYIDHGALVKQRQFVDAGSTRGDGGTVSVNGIKRPAPHGPDGGRGKAPKLLKQLQKDNVQRVSKINRDVAGVPEAALGPMQTLGLLPFGLVHGDNGDSGHDDAHG